MISSYFKSAVRNISKNSLFATLNTFSLILGFGTSLLVFLFVQDERSFDTQHEDIDQLYRICEVQSFPGNDVQTVALSMGPFGPTMKAEFPEVETFTRYWARGKMLWEAGDLELMVDNMVVVDTGFFTMFNYELLKGDKKNILSEPNTAVISRTVAMNLFGTINVVDKSIRQGDRLWNIDGVLEDVPKNSHLQFDILTSMITETSVEPRINTGFGPNYLNTYLKLYPGTNVPELEAKFPDYLLRNAGYEEVNDIYKLFLQPLSEIHLGSVDIEHDYNNYRKFNGSYISIFIIIGIFVLILAGSNFANLSAAGIFTRAREIGVRKYLGAGSGNVFLQFIVEAILFSILAFVVALGLVWLSLLFLNEEIDRSLSLMTIFSNPINLMLALILVLSVGFISGLYPAIFGNQFSLQHGGNNARSKSRVRTALFVIQFTMAMGMISATAVITQQLVYIQNKDIGFDKDHLMVISLDAEASARVSTLKTELLAQDHIQGVAASGQRLGNNLNQREVKVRLDSGLRDFSPTQLLVDYDYLDVYNIDLKEGRQFSKDYASDNGLSFIINESLAREFAFDEPVGRKMGHTWYPNDSLGTIIGVINDFNYSSLHYNISGIVLVLHEDWRYNELSVRLDGENLNEAIANVETAWSSVLSGKQIEYAFLSDHLKELYNTDFQFSKVVIFVAVLAITLSLMGLFGLLSFLIKRKVKEIGIRKVIGADSGSLITLLLKPYGILVTISFVISTPVVVSYLAEWLDQFAYKISISAWPFVMSFIAIIVISGVTVAVQVYRAIKANPVEAIRTE